MVVAIAAPLLAAPRAVAAPDPPSEEALTAARAKLTEGAQHLRQGDYAEALKSFKEAYQIVPSPKIHFNFGLAYQGLARYVEAIESFQHYLEEARPAPSDPNATNARRQIEELSSKVAKVEIKCDCIGADVLIDGRTLGTMPLSRPLVVDPGSHQVALRRGDTAAVQAFEARLGGSVYLELELRTAPTVVAVPVAAPVHPSIERQSPLVSPPPEERTPIYKRPWVWGIVGGAIIAGIVITVLATRSPSSSDPSLGTHPFQ